MPRSKTFTSEHGGPIVVAVPGQSPVPLGAGESYETDDPNVIVAFEANPDVRSGGKRDSGQDKGKKG